MAELNIYMDDDFKVQAEAFLAEHGLTFSSAVHLFLEQTIKVGGLPFNATLSGYPPYSEENRLFMEEWNQKNIVATLSEDK